MSLFLESLIESLKSNREINEILANITGGNIREVVNFVKKFIGNPNVDTDKIVTIMSSQGKYVIPLHEFSKAAILGNYSHYNPESSLATNIFTVNYPDEKEHFLSPLILSFLFSGLSPEDSDGFITGKEIIEEMQRLHFSIKQVEGNIRNLTNRRLIETTQRVTFEESEVGLIGELPSAFRLTTVGSYHLNRWLATFAYLDAMVFDTPIFDEKIFEKFLPNLEKFDIDVRLERTKQFRQYLNSVWNNSGLSVSYFDWNTIIKRDRESFLGVEKAVAKNKHERDITRRRREN